MGVFSTVGSGFESAISSFAATASSGMISLVSPVVTAGVTLYFTLLGYLYMAGRSRDSLPAVMVSGVRIWLTAWVGLSTGNFVSYAVNGISGLESDLLSAMGVTSASFSSLDSLYERGAAAAASIISAVGSLGASDIGAILLLVITAAVVYLALGFLCSLACGILLLAKCSLVIILGFGPLFVCALMFPVTRHWFDGWLRSALSCVFTSAIASAVTVIFMTVLETQVTALETKTAGFASAAEGVISGTFSVSMTLLITSLVCCFVMKAVPGIAVSLTGGVSVAAVSLVGMVKEPALALYAAAAGANRTLKAAVPKSPEEKASRRGDRAVEKIL